jgi:hypothetical protein
MDAESSSSKSEFRFEKRRADAIVTLVSGEAVRGCFFIAGGSEHHAGPERIRDLLNAEPGFLPFETQADGAARMVLYNPSHVISVQVFDDEAQREPGYGVARRRGASILLSNGQRADGTVRVYLPEGRDRLSDWTRQTERFRYVEGDTATYIVNADHIVAVTEVSGS